MREGREVVTFGESAQEAGQSGRRPGDPDAVEQARRWLAEQGVEVPESVPPHTHQGADGRGASRRSRLPGPQEAPSQPEAGESPAGAAGPSRLFDDGDADPVSVARTIVLRKLAAQSRTRAELERALKRKQVPDDAARTVLDRMEAVGLVDDRGFARDWVESRQQRRHLSKSALRRELTAKGVDRSEIETALDVVDGEDELGAARTLAAKKAQATLGLDPQVRYRRLAGVLARRGFSPSVVGRVLAETLSGQDVAD